MNLDRLKEEIDIELNELSLVVNDLNLLLDECKTKEPSNIQKAAASSLTAQFYSGIENILKRFTKYCDIALPKGDDWHVELFNRFCSPEYTGLPMLFDDYLKEELTNYRRFRHFVYHGYSNKISWDRLNEGIKNISDIFQKFRESLDDAINSL